MNNAAKILQTLSQIWPEWMSNTQLESMTGIKPHQQVFKLTSKLMSKGLIVGQRRAEGWLFRSIDSTNTLEEHTEGEVEIGRRNSCKAATFESTAREVLRATFGASLEPRSLAGVPKKFDFVSPDGKIVGDAKFFDMVNGRARPPAKFAIIAEHVWLLEKTEASCRFLVFGNNRNVPTTWLKKYGHLLERVAIIFLGHDGRFEVLSDPSGTFSRIRGD